MLAPNDYILKVGKYGKVESRYENPRPSAVLTTRGKGLNVDNYVKIREFSQTSMVSTAIDTLAKSYRYKRPPRRELLTKVSKCGLTPLDTLHERSRR